MRIALIDASPKSPFYPLPLLKIGAWRRSLGDTCQIFIGTLPDPGTFDAIWLTTRFTFDLPFALALCVEAKNRAADVWVGGISASLLPEYYEAEGLRVHKGLLPEAEAFAPDYSLLDTLPNYSITHTSRGCIRHCKFCMVHRLEPDFADHSWAADVHPLTTKILFYDNNWLAKPDIRPDVDKIKVMPNIKKVDFNQGLDARLVTPDIADMLAEIPLDPIRFAFDGMHEDGHYQNAVRLMRARSHAQIGTYTLYNFMDKPADFYYRLRETVLLQEELGGTIYSFPMRYQPILDIDKGRDYVGRHWTKEMRGGFMAILQKQSINGQVSCDLEEFEYWFGDTADQFVKLISYPHIRKLCERKRTALRLRRAK